jgi:hypothetical protein
VLTANEGVNVPKDMDKPDNVDMVEFGTTNESVFEAADVANVNALALA